METKNIHIYTLRDPRDKVVRYVGKTNNPKKRLIDHKYEARKGRYNYKRCEWIKELLDSGFEPEMETVLIVSESEWETAEQEVIAMYNEYYPLLNMTEGGQVIAKENRYES